MNKTLEEKLSQGRQYRKVYSIGIESRAKGEDKEPEMYVEGYATIFNEPYVLFNDGEYKVSEQVDSHAFDECDMADTILQYNHEGKVYARISNNTLTVEPDEKGLHIRAYLGGTAIGRDLYEEIKGGYTNKMSFGFTVTADDVAVDEENKTVLRTIQKIGKLYDVSAVSIPANDATEISARNFCDGVIEEIKQEVLKKEQEKEQRKKTITKIKILAEVQK